jgi:hypothetical protein
VSLCGFFLNLMIELMNLKDYLQLIINEV